MSVDHPLATKDRGCLQVSAECVRVGGKQPRPSGASVQLPPFYTIVARLVSPE